MNLAADGPVYVDPGFGTVVTITVVIAILAIGLGLGDILMSATNHEVRRWGRALKHTTPIATGAVVLGAGFDLELTVKVDDVIWIIALFLIAVAAFRGMESKRLRWLKPTD
ncbi:hypothetical protein ACN27E_23590 [Mycobacterium sp. WMMD1722]|uniref:hypothetical protein n=1 Tax=Mycobacterium sp. WMMD1722 TaxID=3404117 RepID=UPI003BF54B1D